MAVSLVPVVAYEREACAAIFPYGDNFLHIPTSTGIAYVRPISLSYRYTLRRLNFMFPPEPGLEDPDPSPPSPPPFEPRAPLFGAPFGTKGVWADASAELVDEPRPSFPLPLPLLGIRFGSCMPVSGLMPTCCSSEGSGSSLAPWSIEERSGSRPIVTPPLLSGAGTMLGFFFSFLPLLLLPPWLFWPF